MGWVRVQANSLYQSIHILPGEERDRKSHLESVACVLKRERSDPMSFHFFRRRVLYVYIRNGINVDVDTFEWS